MGKLQHEQRSAASTSTASSSSSLDQVPAHTQHSYPPPVGASRYRDDGDTVEAEEDDEHDHIFDEEEQVGLMQKDRNGARKGMPDDPISTRDMLQKARTSRMKGLGIFGGVILFLLLSIPALQWFSSATNSHVPARPVGGNSIPPAPSSSSSKTLAIHKVAASKNDQAGRWGLGAAADFQPAYQLPGWSTPKAAAQVLGVPAKSEKLLHMNMDVLFNGTFASKSSSLRWSVEDPDVGVFSYVDPVTGDIILEDVTHARKNRTGKGEVAKGGGRVLYVEAKNVKDEHGEPIIFASYSISPDMQYVLFSSARVQQWRYSSHSKFWLYDTQTRQTKAVLGGSDSASIAVAVWARRRTAATGSSNPSALAFVQANDLYIMSTPTSAPIRVTYDGATSVFNGVPDWVYEEEIFGSDRSFWWNPSGTRLVYLRFDEEAVPIYDFPVYNPDLDNAGKTLPYPDRKKMKYPKPGYPNPLVSAHMVDIEQLRSGATGEQGIRHAKCVLSDPAAQSGDPVDAKFEGKDGSRNRLITEVKWLSDDQVLVRETDRYSDVSRHVLFDLLKSDVWRRPADSSAGEQVLVGEVVRRAQTKGGWIDSDQSMVPLGTHEPAPEGLTAYLDAVYTPQGFRHVALFAEARSSTPVFLTAGEWEVDGEIRAVDWKRKLVYFVAAKPFHTQRHVFTVPLPDITAQSLSTLAPVEPTALSDVTRPGTYDVSVDPKGAYYVLTDSGATSPPSQRVVGVDDKTFSLVLEDNAALRAVSAKYVAPQTVFYNITTAAGVSVSVEESRPHDFDPSGGTRYPVLINVYGGPDSQMARAQWRRSHWHQFLVEELGYVIVTLDGRGTGFKGRKYRFPVTAKLGDVESKDVVASAEKLATLAYVDDKRIGVWGWSYGGYLTTKVVERNSNIVSLAMAVAPVTSWRFYDSIYTERYMKDPANSISYSNSSVQHMDGFRHTHFFLAQGSADDNVHFENSAHLLDLLTAAGVRGFRFRMFTDSDHSVSTRSAYRELHEEMTAFLIEKWGPGGRRAFAKPLKELVSRVQARAKGRAREGLLQ